jgi:hypothetical protein
MDYFYKTSAKRLIAGGIGVLLLLLSIYVRGDTTTPAPPAIPEGCKSFTGKYAENGGLRCEVHAYVSSASGKEWGAWVRLTSTAPKGYALRFSEGHVYAGDHKCGVRDEGATAPEWPSPFNGDHQREGQAFWAQCIIRERDASHVVMEFRAQGVEGTSNTFIGTTPNKGAPDMPVNGGAEIIAFYVPVAAH